MILYSQIRTSNNTLNGELIPLYYRQQDISISTSIGQIIAVNSSGIAITSSIDIVTSYFSSDLSLTSGDFDEIVISGANELEITDSTLGLVDISSSTNVSITGSEFQEFIQLIGNEDFYFGTNKISYDGAWEFRGRNYTFIDSDLQTVSLSGVSFSTMQNNEIFAYDYQNGIFISSTASFNNSFINNTIVGAENKAVFISDTGSNNTFLGNDFISNGPGIQIVDNGMNNLFERNSYDDYLEPDKNGDGFVDDPYQFEGSAANSDPLPLTTTSHALGIPSFTESPSGEISEQVTLAWTPVSSTYEFNTSYDLYLIHSNGDIDNILIDTSLTSFTYQFTLSSSESGLKFLLNATAGNLVTSALTTEFDLVVTSTTTSDTTISGINSTPTSTDGGFKNPLPVSTSMIILGLAIIPLVRGRKR